MGGGVGSILWEGFNGLQGGVGVWCNWKQLLLGGPEGVAVTRKVQGGAGA